jgi:hypothetical protein
VKVVRNTQERYIQRRYLIRLCSHTSSPPHSLHLLLPHYACMQSVWLDVTETKKKTYPPRSLTPDSIFFCCSSDCGGVKVVRNTQEQYIQRRYLSRLCSHISLPPHSQHLLLPHYVFLPVSVAGCDRDKTKKMPSTLADCGGVKVVMKTDTIHSKAVPLLFVLAHFIATTLPALAPTPLCISPSQCAWM